MPARLHPLFLLPLTARSPLTYNVPMKTLIYIIGIFFLLTSCYQQEFHPESGDLIFQVGIAGGMTEAIADATGGESDLSFTHVGIITVEPAGIYVLEAKSEPGVTMTPLQKFLDSSATIEGRPAAAIARITLPERRELATRAIGEAKKYLGQPYDDSFLPHNGKMYCSELVWECYLTGSKNEHLFTARPMNFRTADGRLPQFWIDHFAAMDEPIPEGVPGTNPQDMSREKFLKIVYRYWQ